MNISQLPYMLAIASAGSLSAAARQLGISQPALTKYLKTVEAEVGQSLFFRNRNRYILTPAGQIYLNTARQILNLYDNTFTAVEAMRSRVQSDIRLGLSPNRGISMLARIYAQFDQKYPNTQIHPWEGTARDFPPMVLSGELDMAFTTHTGYGLEGIRIIPHQREELVFAVPAFHPAVKHETFLLEELPYADLRDFRNNVFVSPSPGSTMYGLIQQVFHAEGINPEVTAGAPNLLIQEAMIRSGTKVGLLPAYYIRPNRDIAYFRIRNAPLLTACCLVREDRMLSEAEEFLLYLFFRQGLGFANSNPVWNETTRELMRKFDPLEAVAFGVEEAE